MKSYAKWISVLIFTFLLVVAFSMYMLERSVDRHKSDDTDKISEVVDLTDSIPGTLSEVDEANAVYSAILAHERYISDVIIVRDRTFISYFTPFTMTDGSIPELQIDTFKNYKAHNGESQPLSVIPSIERHVVMLSEREEGKLFGRRRWDWDRFRKVYPEAKGIISLSNIGFNATRTQALVYAAIGCGSRCGEGSFILLQKVNGRWSVQLKIVAVVS